MDEDCLNAAEPDQFLPIKNMLKIKLLNDGATDSDHDLNK